MKIFNERINLPSHPEKCDFASIFMIIMLNDVLNRLFKSSEKSLGKQPFVVICNDEKKEEILGN
jgi:hypothetical protein